MNALWGTTLVRLLLAASVTIVLGSAATFGQAARSQDTTTRPPTPASGTQAQQEIRANAVDRVRSETERGNHRFWDKQNDWLFAGVGVARTLDYFSTLNMRSRGRQEILLTNDLVDNHAAFAIVEAAGTGASIGASYLFHRYHHHALERWTSYVHIGLATSGAIRNYCLKTAHPAPAPAHP